MEINWNCPVLNSTETFLNPEVFEKCSLYAYNDNLIKLNELINNSNDNKRQKKKKKKKKTKNIKIKTPIEPAKTQSRKRKLTSYKQFLKPSIRIPNTSTLSGDEQKKYLELLTKYLNKPPVNGNKELVLFTELEKKVTKEQEEFIKYALTIGKCCWDDYAFINDKVFQYIKQMALFRVKFVEQYPRFYTLFETYPLCTEVTNPEQQLQLHFVKSLLELGKICTAIVPNLSLRPLLMDHYDRVCKRFPPCGTSNNKPRVSKDSNAEKLAKKYNVDFVLSSSSLQALVSLQPPEFICDWELPITIVEYPMTGCGKTGTKKIIYVDKPFIKKEMNSWDKNIKFHKFAVKTLLAHPHHVKLVKMGTKLNNNKEQELNTSPNKLFEPSFIEPLPMDDIFGGNETDQELDTFGTGVSIEEFNHPSPVKRKRFNLDDSKFPVNKHTVQDIDFANAYKSKLEIIKKNAAKHAESFEKDERKQNLGGNPSFNCTNDKDIDPDINKTLSECFDDRIFKRNPESEIIRNSDSDGDSSLNESGDETKLIINTEEEKPFSSVLSRKLNHITMGKKVSKLNASAKQTAESVGHITLQSKSIKNSISESESGLNDSDEETKLIIDIGEEQSSLSDKASKRKSSIQPSGECMELIGLVTSHSSYLNQSVSENDNVNKHDRNIPNSNKNEVKAEVFQNNHGKDLDVFNSRNSIDSLESESKEKEFLFSKPKRNTKSCSLPSEKSNTAMDSSQSSGRRCSLRLQKKKINKSSLDKIEVHKKTEGLKSIKKISVISNNKIIPSNNNEVTTLDQILQMQEKMLNMKPNKNIGQNTEVLEKQQPLLDSRTKNNCDGKFQNRSFNKTMSGKINSISLDDPKDFVQPPDNENVNYSLWTLGNLQLLIRHRIHAMFRDAQGQVKYVHLVPKLEYQPAFGGESVTKSECAQQWISTYIRRNCRIIRARINVFSSEVLLLEELDGGNILHTKNTINIPLVLSSLKNLLDKFSSLPAGNYLVTHESKKPCISIYKNLDSNRRGAVDLHYSYAAALDCQTTRDGHEVVELDPNIFFPHHVNLNRIPVTFEPKDYINPLHYHKKNNPAKKRKKKSKKKKAKKKNKAEG